MPWQEGLAASSVPWTLRDPTYRPRCPQGTKESQDRALALPPTYVTSAKIPPGLRLSHQKATQPEMKEQVKKEEGGSHGSLAMGQPRPADRLLPTVVTT